MPSIVDRLGKAKRRGESTMGWLRSEHNRRVEGRPQPEDGSGLYTPERWAAEKLHSCGQLLHFHEYYTVGKLRLVKAYFCKQHLLCPACAIRRGGKLMGRYLQRFNLVMAEHPDLIPATMVYTVKNGHDLAERMAHLKAGLKALMQRRRDRLKGLRRAVSTEWEAIAGGVGSIEISYDPKTGWHPHCHMLVLLRRYVHQPTLSAEWKHLTGDSFIVGVTRLHSYTRNGIDPDALAGDFAEVFKYAVKFSALDPAQTWAARNVVRQGKTRLLFNFGLLFGVKEPDELTDEPLEGLPFVHHFFRYLTRLGYQYEPAEKHLPPEPDDGSESFVYLDMGRERARQKRESEAAMWREIRRRRAERQGQG